MTAVADIIDSELLPPRLIEFERLIGLPATMDLVRVYGGLRIFIPTPARVHAEHPLAQIIGVERLMALAKMYGGEAHFALPKAQKALLAVRNARIAHAYAHCKTVRELATDYRLTERQVERIVASAGVRAPTDRRQSTLF
jgi:hypothetical protein